MVSSGPAGQGHPRDRAVLIYIGLALLLLAPGLLAANGVVGETTPVIGPFVGPMHEAMQAIVFGHGIRFWLGVAGLTMMVLLLLYPLRKLFGFGGWISVGGWFHFHLIFGLLGPVMVLYHSYFGRGSTPANVALVTTLVVAVSGLFGHYVYSRLSADFHGERKRAMELLETVVAALNRFGATPTRTRLVDDLRAYESRMADARKGMFGRIGFFQGLRATRRELLARANWLVDNQGPQDGLSPSECREIKARIHTGMTSFFGGLGRSQRRGVLERTAAFWRLLHMPLFFITVIAASIHVYKVWGIDMGFQQAGQIEEGRGGAPGGDPGREGPQKSVSDVAGVTATREGQVTQRGDDATPKPSVLAPRRVTIETVPPPSGMPQGGQVLDRDAIARAIDAPVLVEGPRLAARRPSPAERADEPPVETTAPAPVAKVPKPRVPEVAPSKPVPEVVRAPTPPTDLAPPRPTERVAKAVTPPAKKAAPVPSSPEPGDPVSALGAKVAQWDNTGTLDPKTVSERIAILKKDRSFRHDKTRFPLTGKHRQVDCANCHKTTLKDTPRQCIDCHRQDDVHRGRRPKCESCHVTTNWGTIKRK